MKLDAPEPLDELLERAGENRFARKQLPIPLARWRAAVGPRIADRTRPVALERGTLVVRVVTSVWANELSMLAPEVIAKLAEHGYDVKALRFRVGPLEVLEGIAQQRDYRRVPPPAPLDAALQASLSRLGDDELRSTIERAARANLAWQSPPPAAEGALTGAKRGARAPRSAETGSAPPDRSDAGSASASRCSSAGAAYRRK